MSNQGKTKDRFVVIMAGGRGERFWPVSREKTPKQLIALLGKRSFLQQAVDRVAALVPKENIFVITNKHQEEAVRAQLPKVPEANIVAEPVGRDTCAAVTLGAALVGARSEQAVMAVLPADHVIPDKQKFQQVLSDAFEWAKWSKQIITIGIKPTEPATGFGYIQFGEPMAPPQGLGRRQTRFYEGKKFVEKPDYELAVQYVESGYYRWNAGMFIWSFETVFEGLARHEPEMAEACRRWMKKASDPTALQRTLARDYRRIKKISIDYALLENADNVVLAEGDFTWDDLGAWPALARHLSADDRGNCAVGDFVHVDAERNIVFDVRRERRSVVAAVGIQDTIIVLTDDATLVTDKKHAQKIKELVSMLSKSKKYKKLI